MVSWVPLAGQIALPQGVTPASQKSTEQIQRSAAELLSRYTKQKDGNFLFQMRGALGEQWVESNGLAVSSVTPYHVTPADRANGINAIHIVSVDTRMSRTYDPKTTKWSEWSNGRYAYVPGAIRVTESHNGQLAAEASMLAYFVSFTARGNPDLVPCVREQVIQAPVSLPQIQIPAPLSAPANKEQPAKPNPMQVATDQLIYKAVGLAAVLAVFIVIAGILATLLRGTSKRGRTNPTLGRQLPPPLQAESLFPPDPSLIVAQTHLLTPAERSFLTALESIVQPTCAISTKVRLADLFQVKQGRGQQSAFNRISRKHVDFVLTDPATTRILCAIELDDSSHNRPDRIARDQFVDELFANNQMPLIHIPFEWKYNPSAIRAKLIQAGILLSPAE